MDDAVTSDEKKDDAPVVEKKADEAAEKKADEPAAKEVDSAAAEGSTAAPVAQ